MRNESVEHEPAVVAVLIIDRAARESNLCAQVDGHQHTNELLVISTNLQARVPSSIEQSSTPRYRRSRTRART